jgi:hypothetical protein
MENIILRIFSLLLICLGGYVFFRPVVVSEKITKFYSNYPIIRYSGEKQLTSRPGLVRVVGAVIAVVGTLCLISV